MLSTVYDRDRDTEGDREQQRDRSIPFVIEYMTDVLVCLSGLDARKSQKSSKI